MTALVAGMLDSLKGGRGKGPATPEGNPSREADLNLLHSIVNQAWVTTPVSKMVIESDLLSGDDSVNYFEGEDALEAAMSLRDLNTMFYDANIAAATQCTETTRAQLLLVRHLLDKLAKELGNARQEISANKEELEGLRGVAEMLSEEKQYTAQLEEALATAHKKCDVFLNKGIQLKAGIIIALDEFLARKPKDQTRPKAIEYINSLRNHCHDFRFNRDADGTEADGGGTESQG